MESHEYTTMFRVEETHWWYRSLRALLDQHWRLYAPARPCRFLDVGCGTGANLAHLTERGKAFGIDIAPEAIRFCRQRGQMATAQASGLALPFAEAAFDAAICLDVLYHKNISDRVAFLQEVMRVLKPGGVVFLNVPAFQWLYSSHDRAIHTGRRFTRRELRQILTLAGLRPLSLTYWNSVLFPAALVVRAWRRLFPQAGSDLEGGSGERVSRLFTALLGVERRVIDVAPLPFGLSVFAVAQRPRH